MWCLYCQNVCSWFLKCIASDAGGGRASLVTHRIGWLFIGLIFHLKSGQLLNLSWMNFLFVYIDLQGERIKAAYWKFIPAFNSLQSTSWKLNWLLRCQYERILKGTVLGTHQSCALTTSKSLYKACNLIITPETLISQSNCSQMQSKLTSYLVWEMENVVIILTIKILPRHKDYYYFFSFFCFQHQFFSFFTFP